MVYLDYASSTPLDSSVLESYNKILSSYFANPSAIHSLGLESNQINAKSRNLIASILNVNNDEIIFTSGASESNNFAIKGVAFEYKNRGKHLITSKVEHPSVLKVFEQLEKEFGFEVDYLDVDRNGVITLENLKKHLRDDTILVSLMHVNNESGSINDIENLAKFVKENNPKCFFHCDDTQGFGKIDLNLKYIDLLSMSAHKIYGLKGSGLLIKKSNVSLTNLICGGEQEFGLRAGTTNFALNAALAKTIRLQFENKQKDYEHVYKLNKLLREKLSTIDSILINSPINGSPYILNFSFKNKRQSIVSEYLNNKGICVSTTSACGSGSNPYSYVILDMFNDLKRAENAIRISFSKFNSEDDVNYLVDQIINLDKEIIGE